MAMNIGANSNMRLEPMMEINTTPLIDVMLVLLVMLIITIPLQMHSVELNLPVGGKIQPLPPVVQVYVDFDGSISMDGAVIAGSTGNGELDARFRAIAALADQPEVQLRANNLVNYGRVVTVMATAQRLGVNNISIVGAERYTARQ